MISRMSESATLCQVFFLCPLQRADVPHTLLLAGAEDRALPGGNLSADSGAKTRLGPASPAPQQKVIQLGLALKRQNPRGLGTESLEVSLLS